MRSTKLAIVTKSIENWKTDTINFHSEPSFLNKSLTDYKTTGSSGWEPFTNKANVDPDKINKSILYGMM